MNNRKGGSVENKQKNIVDRIWDLFASVKLAIVVFALIGLTSIIGTVIEQDAPREKNITVISKLFGSGSADTLYDMFDKLGFLDMYKSWWFTGLLGLFAANLLICSIDRLPAVWKLIHQPIKPVPDDQMKGLSIKREYTVGQTSEKTRATVDSALKSAGFSILQEHKEGSALQIFAEKGRWSRLGVYITHLSLLLIMAGAVVGLWVGFKGYTQIGEGDYALFAFATNQAPLTDTETHEANTLLDALDKTRGNISAAAQSLNVSEKALSDRLVYLGIYNLGFTVRCDDFKVDFYGESDTPSEYLSLLTIVDGGKEIMSKWIRVNDPLEYKGIVFYQSSYGMARDLSKVVYRFKLRGPSGATESVDMKTGQTFNIPGTNMSAKVADFSPAIGFNKNTGEYYTYEKERANNPAVKLEITTPKGKRDAWVLQRYPDTGNFREENVIIELADIWGLQYTGIQVRKDPGVWIVYLGCVFMAIGLFMSFFMSHRRIWVALHPAKNQTKVTVGASSSKNKLGYETTIDKAFSHIKEGGK